MKILIRSIRFLVIYGAIFLLSATAFGLVLNQGYSSGQNPATLLLVSISIMSLTGSYLLDKRLEINSDFRFLTWKLDQYRDVSFFNSDVWNTSSQRLRGLVKTDKRAAIRLGKLDDIASIKWRVREHLAPLTRNMQTAIKLDDYGGLIADERVMEAQNFLKSTNFSANSLSEEQAVELVFSSLGEFSQQLRSQDFDPDDLPEHGIDFEHWVAENLKKFNWKARVTQASNDQGLDVIAEKNNIKVAIQCKLYNSNVGNKAVQEIYAAQTYYDLDRAAVISSMGYTRSAKELARKNNVILLSPHDLPRFDEIFLN